MKSPNWDRKRITPPPHLGPKPGTTDQKEAGNRAWRRLKTWATGPHPRLEAVGQGRPTEAGRPLCPQSGVGLLWNKAVKARDTGTQEETQERRDASSRYSCFMERGAS